MSSPAPGALVGVRVIDLSRLLPGPYATRVLAEMGAEVIKIEAPQGGDYARWYPPLVGEPPVGGAFRELNFGKKSVALDLKTSVGMRVLRRLVEGADVLVDSFRPGVLKRLGLDPDALLETHPRLIYCAITGYGQTGPDRARAGHDIGYAARAGVLGISGPVEQPQVAGFQVADIGAALAAVGGVTAALFARSQSGRGRKIDISLTESSMAFASFAFGNLGAGRVAQRGQEMLDGSKPCYRTYKTKDGGFLAVGALEPKFWTAFLTVIGMPELLGNALDTGDGGDEIVGRISARLLQRTRDEWMQAFEGIEACVEPVLNLDEVAHDPHLVARGAFAEGEGGRFVRSPIRDSAGAATLSAPPALGADTAPVLQALGVDADDLEEVLGALQP